MNKGLMLSICLSVAGMFGCADQRPPVRETATVSRPDPMRAFDDLGRKALEDDRDYVRGHMAPGFLAEAQAQGADTASAQFLTDWMSQLALCRAMAASVTPDSNDAVATVVSVNPALFGGTMGKFRIKMSFDPERGWMLAGLPYDRGTFHGKVED